MDTAFRPDPAGLPGSRRRNTRLRRFVLRWGRAQQGPPVPGANGTADLAKDGRERCWVMRPLGHAAARTNRFRMPLLGVAP